ncbi:UNVERIFIED_CONTAM: hypothetical protein FKN15_002774 [Acipenser sinensis]
MADQEVSVREFVAVTDVDEERARFFLESAGWDLQLALASFFEDGADDDIVTLPPPEPSAVPRPTAPRFYAGGSERSGQQIVGPPKKKSSNEVVEDLFKGAKEHGAVPVDKASKGPGESSKGRVFGGGGYRLGATPEEQSAYVTAQKRSTEPAQDVHVVLKLWKSGFSLDDGEVSDVRQFILGARPSMAAAEFVLMTTFPNKELADESQTLKDANLLNAVIVQRLK